MVRAITWGLPLLLLLTGAACAAPLVGGVDADTGFASRLPTGLDRHLPVPEGNRLSRAKVALGRRLFFDTILSEDRSMACASCHDPATAFTNGLPTSLGVHGRRGRRNVPTLVNRAYGKSFFWDGRTSTLESQVLRPVEDPTEMGLAVDRAVRRLVDDPSYRAEFRQVFTRDPGVDQLGQALASYVRTILAGDTAYDRHARGDTSALSVQARRGLEVFRRNGCVACHVGPNFTDEQFHNTGVAWRNGMFADDGRFLVTGRPEDRGAFKTPTLREVARTAPYMHDGSLPTLDAVLDFYSRGGRTNPNLDRLVRRLEASVDERQALLTFFESLSGSVVEGMR
jgi:cytochrome c peroxidase